MMKAKQQYTLILVILTCFPNVGSAFTSSQFASDSSMRRKTTHIPSSMARRRLQTTTTTTTTTTKRFAQLIEDTTTSSTSTKSWFSAISTAIPVASKTFLPPGILPRGFDMDDIVTATPLPRSTSAGSVPSLTVSLVKQIVGGGVLALPAAVATMGDVPETVTPIALTLIAVMGTINAYYFHLMGQVCSMTGATTFATAWERSVGPSTTPLVAGLISFKTLLSCLCYSMILGDSFSSLAMTFGWDNLSRMDALLAVTGTALLPLCLLKDLSSLAPFSLAGICGFAATAACMSARAMDGSYHLAPLDTPSAGRFLQDLADPMVPSFGDVAATTASSAGGHIDELQGLVLACTLATAFVSHYNAPRFHSELDDKSQFDKVTGISFGISAAIMAVIAVAGYNTFGIASQPMILANYSPYDPLITGCRAAIAASLVMTFPLPFVGLRDGVLDAMKVSPEVRQDDVKMSALTVALLAVITGLALSVHDLSLLLSVGGGTISTAVSSVFPTIMYRSALAKQQEQQSPKKTSKTTSSKSATTIPETPIDPTLFATGLMGFCVATGLTGVGLALQTHFG